MNRVFTHTQKRHLYIANDGLCTRCGGDLGDDWEAHHVTRYADGGITELTNAAAVCRSCHVAIHRSIEMNPRGWQVKALKKFQNHQKKAFLLEATPGAGKTIFSAFCAQYLIESGSVDFTVCVVPTTALKGDKEAGFLGDFNKLGVQITTVLRDGRDAPKEFSGAVVTYAQLPNLVESFNIWARKGMRLFFIFDEVHHASEKNKWGSATELCGKIATSTLAMTGTLFRGDGHRISFVNYDSDNITIPDEKYTYQTAVTQSVCRSVFFIHDTGTAEYLIGEEQEKIEIAETKEDQAGKVQNVIFSKDAEWLETVLAKADETLDEYRYSSINAGGIVICRPGVNDDDDRHLFEVAKSVERLTGEKPTVITHEDPDANGKIDRFRTSREKWIVSVRKVSEGVDIKRLRVMVLATYPGTELLFRQLVGRIVRVVDEKANEDATLYMAKFPRLVEYASRIEEEAKAGLKEKKEQKKRGEKGGGLDFIPLGSTHIDGGGLSSLGEQYAAYEIEYAERMKRDDRQLSNVSITSIAHLMRKAGIEIPESEAREEPLALRKKRRRSELNTLVRRTAILVADRNNMSKPDFGFIWGKLNRNLGVKNLDDLTDNHPIEKTESAISMVKSLLQEFGRAA